MAIIAKVTIVGNKPPVETPQQPQSSAQSFSEIRRKAKPIIEEKPAVQKPIEQQKPTLAKRRNINTVYSDKIDVSKPSKYTEHFLKKE